MCAGEQTILEFCKRPSRVGRARIFAAYRVGLDDSGMVAYCVLVSGAVQARP